ncbi:MAG: DUF4102 domain-containing protein, partial [Parafilimonas terrae]|nr:DUF4102 domain-containing protein [Parafilimonas terrae]
MRLPSGTPACWWDNRWGEPRVSRKKRCYSKLGGGEGVFPRTVPGRPPLSVTCCFSSVALPCFVYPYTHGHATIRLLFVGSAVGIVSRRAPGQLSALKVSRTREPGLYADGGGLYLQVTNAEARSWIFRFMLNGRARSMGLGSLHTLTLAEARSKATECRKLCLDGIDPIATR